MNTQKFHFVDLPLIADTNLSHANWPIKRIIEIFSALDNVIRVAKVKASQGVYIQPTANLCLLEGVD